MYIKYKITEEGRKKYEELVGYEYEIVDLSEDVWMIDYLQILEKDGSIVPEITMDMFTT